LDRNFLAPRLLRRFASVVSERCIAGRDYKATRWRSALGSAVRRRQPRHFVRQLRPLLCQNGVALASFWVHRSFCQIDALARAPLALLALCLFSWLLIPQPDARKRPPRLAATDVCCLSGRAKAAGGLGVNRPSQSRIGTPRPGAVCSVPSVVPARSVDC
jgi:hypothetical protein